MSKELLNHIADTVNRMDDRQEKMAERLTRCEAHIKENKDDIREHMKRTAIAESRIEDIDRERKFVKWLIGGIASTIGLSWAIVKLLEAL